MLTLPASLLAHQRGPRRRPALALVLSRRRTGIPWLAFGDPEALPGSEAPHALAISSAGTRVQAVNDAGSLRVRRGAGAWSAPITTLPAGASIALAAVPGELVIVYADGLVLRSVRSTDDGATWAAPAALVSETVAIGAVALAGRQSNGNLCAFYAIGTAPTVKRLRRTTGVWAASGTTWTAGSSWATVTGLAAVHVPNDFHVLVTGTAPTTGDALVAIHVMGDGTLPANSWFGPMELARADQGGATLERPAIAHPGGGVAAWRESMTAPVADARVVIAQAVTGPLAPWAEPVPFMRGAPFGVALAATTTELLMATVGAVRSAPLADTLDLSSRLLVARWWLEATGSLGVVEVNDQDGLVHAHPLPKPGAGVELTLGYRSGAAGAAEYGLTVRGAVRSVEFLRPWAGHQRARLVIDGPWERLAAYRAPATWRTPANTTRGSVLTRLAARAGIPISSAGDLPPSGAWTTETVDFAIQIGESARQAALRLLEPTADAFRGESELQICGLSGANPVVATLGGAGHPLYEFQPSAGGKPAWVRVQGPDRVAEEFSGPDLLRDAPALRARRDMGATSDTLASAAADRLLARLRRGSTVARAVVPLHAGLQLYDVVTVVHPLAPAGSANYRVLGVDLTYRAGAIYEQRLTLGGAV